MILTMVPLLEGLPFKQWTGLLQRCDMQLVAAGFSFVS